MIIILNKEIIICAYDGIKEKIYFMCTYPKYDYNLPLHRIIMGYVTALDQTLSARTKRSQKSDFKVRKRSLTPTFSQESIDFQSK